MADENEENQGGRPETITDEVTSELGALFERGHSVKKALEIEHISQAAFYRKAESDPEFRERMVRARNFGVQLAGQIVVDVLMEKDKKYLGIKANMAKWYLEKKEPEEYGTINITAQLTQNNYNFITDEQFKHEAEDKGVTRLNPGRIIEALKAGNVVREGSESNPLAVH
jgi:hypothetical protein